MSHSTAERCLEGTTLDSRRHHDREDHPGPRGQPDYAVYAVGSTGAAATVPGAADLSHSIAEYEHAGRRRAAVADSPADAAGRPGGGRAVTRDRVSNGS
ncbi:hypothetical protein C3E78_07905 [Aeromicrobium chenweiae]|uniref:Uncharacterized protein n=1 Tax=Aeromicrobium chenweiae TaxID=2079793 RepID=A0A2S0WLE0_9ACTN|nr:hypothetical protein C3E78_07905 [Aeromicrobium chenweiae]TGN32977.1 hypothetical protein E4L97_09875 [Aeromicrobium chenweiae]